MLVPRRHVTALDELTATEAEELGPLLRAVTRALRLTEAATRRTWRCSPRQKDSRMPISMSSHVMEILTPELRGPRVFNLLGADPDRSVPDAAMDEIALRIAAALTARRETTGRPGT